MTSLSDLDLDSVAREIAAPPPPPEPSLELIAKAGAYLERRGWTRAVAGDADFAAHRVIWGDSTAAMWELKANWSGFYRYVTPDGDTMTLKILDSGNVAWTGLLGNGRAVIGSTTLLHEDAALIRTPFAVAYAPAASKKVKSGKTTTTVKYPVFCDVISFKYDGPPPGEPAERRSN